MVVLSNYEKIDLKNHTITIVFVLKVKRWQIHILRYNKKAYL